MRKMLQVLLVNPFASSRYLFERFRSFEVKTIALYTIDFAIIPAYLMPKDDLFDEQIRFKSENWEEIVAKLGDKKFDYVVNGFEMSVELSDRLAEHYTPQYANNPETAKLRSDKYEMHKALERKGVSHIRQFLYDINDDLPKIEDYGINYPCFVKPLAAAVSLGASKIYSEFELVNYFKGADQYKNFWQNESNQDKFLIAEYVVGQELFVDTFSVNGQHHIATIQKYCKEDFNGHPVCYYNEPVDDPNIRRLAEEYIKQILDATELRNGFAHTELFLLPNNELKLIEINPRVSGASGMVNKMTMLNNGRGQVSLLMNNVFGHDLSTGDGKYSRCVIISNLSGKPLYNLKENLKKYSTVFEVLQLVADGHVLDSLENITLADASALVLLRSDSLDQVVKDTEGILAQDKLGWN